MDDTACNFDENNVFEANDECFYGDDYYDCEGCISNDYNQNGICDELEVYGCTDISACNFSADANVDDGTCQGVPENFCDCFSTVPDSDNDGVCDEDEVLGCDIPGACNYEVEVTENDGSCDFCTCNDLEELPCYDSNALNFGSVNSAGCIYLTGYVDSDDFQGQFYFSQETGGLEFEWFSTSCLLINSLLHFSFELQSSEGSLILPQVNFDCETAATVTYFEAYDYEAYIELESACYPSDLQMVLGCDTIDLSLPSLGADSSGAQWFDPEIEFSSSAQIELESQDEEVLLDCTLMGVDFSASPTSDLRLVYGRTITRKTKIFLCGFLGI